MTNYKLVPVKQIREVIYVLEKFANDTFRGRNAARDLRELLSPAAEGEEIMVSVGYDVYTLPLHPTGLLSGPRFVVHVPGPEALAKHQPCGCVLCTCEDEKQCQGCGAKFCGNHTDHPAYVKQQPAAVFRNDGNTEDDFIAHEANACTACGGSGHKADQQPAEKGEVVVTRNESGEIVLVSRQDSEGRILSVIAEAATKPDAVADVEVAPGVKLPFWLLDYAQKVDAYMKLNHPGPWKFGGIQSRNDDKPDAVAGLVEKVRELRAFADEARDTYRGSHASGTFRAIVRQIDELAAALATQHKEITND